MALALRQSLNHWMLGSPRPLVLGAHQWPHIRHHFLQLMLAFFSPLTLEIFTFIKVMQGSRWKILSLLPQVACSTLTHIFSSLSGVILTSFLNLQMAYVTISAFFPLWELVFHLPLWKMRIQHPFIPLPSFSFCSCACCTHTHHPYTYPDIHVFPFLHCPNIITVDSHHLFYKIAANIELANTEPLVLGKIQG